MQKMLFTLPTYQMGSTTTPPHDQIVVTPPIPPVTFPSLPELPDCNADFLKF